MADEGMIGFGFMSVSGVIWLIFSGIFKTPSFEEQILHPQSEPNVHLGISDSMGVMVADIAMVLMVLGPIVFWIIVPLAKYGVVRRRRRLRSE